jgi:hypothetical protein
MKMAVVWDVSIIAMMMKAASTSETSVNIYQTTRCNIQEGSHLHTHRCENLKSHRYVRIIVTDGSESMRN